MTTYANESLWTINLRDHTLSIPIPSGDNWSTGEELQQELEHCSWRVAQILACQAQRREDAADAARAALPEIDCTDCPF